MDNARALVLVQGDPFAWSCQHAAMTGVQLLDVEAELSSMLRHPVTQMWVGWRKAANARLSVIQQEWERREKITWQGAEDLLGTLSKIFDAGAL